MLFEEYKAELEVEKRQHEMQGRARVRQLSWYLSASFFVILTTLSVVFYLFPTERPTGAEALKLAVSLAAALAGYALGRLRPDKRTSGDSVSKASRR